MGSCEVSDVPLAALPRSAVTNSLLLGVQGKVLLRVRGLLCFSRSLPENKVMPLQSSSGPHWVRAGVVRAAPSSAVDATCCLPPPCEMMDAQVSAKDLQQAAWLTGLLFGSNGRGGLGLHFQDPFCLSVQ